MQKKLIALAIAGLSSAAFAQSNVTIYGVMDASFDNVSATGATQNATSTLTGTNQPGYNRVNSNSSYIGFKGSESLGNGLTAVFQLENQVAIDNGGGANAFSNRDTFVGLAGNFGTVVAGNLTGPYRAAVATFDPTPGATSSAAGVMNIAGRALTSVGTTLAAAGANTTAVGGLTTTAIRLSNAIAYVSPSFSGFQVTAGFSGNPFAAVEAKTVDPKAAGVPTINTRGYTLGATYDNGPLKVRAAWQGVKDAPANFTNDFTANAAGDTTLVANGRAANSKVDSWILGAAYTFGGATTVGLAYDQNKVTATDDLTAGGVIAVVGANNTRINESKLKTWVLSLKHVMGANEFAFTYGRSKASIAATTGATALTVAGLQDQGANEYTLRYGYNLSKRTQAYAYYSQMNNERNGVFNFMTNSTAGAGTGATAAVGADPRAIGAGLRHNF